MLIYEKTHDNLYSVLDKIIKIIIKPFYANEEEKELVKDISSFFDNTNGIKVFLVLEKRNQSLREAEGVTTNDKQNRELTITIIKKKFPGIVSTLKHELTHVLDWIQTDQKSKKQKKGYFTSFDSYMLDVMELNEFIHNYKLMFDMIQHNHPKILDSIKKSFYEIKTKNDFLIFFEKAFNELVRKAIQNNKHLYRKIIERLAREKLLPPNFDKQLYKE